MLNIGKKKGKCAALRKDRAYPFSPSRRQIDCISCNGQAMIIFPEARCEKFVLSNTISENLVLGNASSMIWLDMEDIGSLRIIIHYLWIEWITVYPCIQVFIETGANYAFVARKDKAIAGPVVRVDVWSVKTK
jgi:hypothetical protein